MSIGVMNAVWKKAPYKGNTLLTLLALADWSNDDGLSWPRIDTLAQKSRQSVRSVQYALELLKGDYLLEVRINPGRGNRSEYQINMQKLHHFESAEIAGIGADFAQKGAKHDSAIRKNHHEPSMNHKPPGVVARESRERDAHLEELRKRGVIV